MAAIYHDKDGHTLTMFIRVHGILLALALGGLGACAPFGTIDNKPRAPVMTPAAADEPRLKAAEARLDAGDLAQARATLRQVDNAQLSAPQRTYRQILESKLALAEDRPLHALQFLPRPGTVTDAGLAARVEEERARALFRMGDAIGATEALRRRGSLINDPQFQAENLDLLWNELGRADLGLVTAEQLQRAAPATRGWVELAVISRAAIAPTGNLPKQLEHWQQRYPDHPGIARIDAIAATPAPRAGIRSVALLVPLTGPYAATGEAVRDGFLSGYYQLPGSPITAKVYDTGETVDTFLRAWKIALDQGAEFVVGPLLRDMVNALAASGRPPVPVLALNYLDPGQVAPFNFFQLGLAPEDEARQAAERATMDGQYHAVALVPEGDWGTRILQAFRERYEALGGRVIAESSYSADSRDHSSEIRTLLALDWSEERHRTLTTTLGAKTEFEPRRRQDVDMVFLAARPDQARLLGPQFRFHRSAGLPIYTTATIYDGEAPAMDLNGLRFCDMPWMLAGAGAADERWAVERALVGNLFPRHRSDYARLLALGRDASGLIPLIENGQLQQGTYFPAASGTLSLDSNGVIRRRLSCVEIDRGKLVAVNPALPSKR